MGSEQFTRNKQYFVDRVSREMQFDLAAPELSRRDALAAACRILAREGHESGLAGQVTARGEQFEELREVLAEIPA